MTAKKPLSLAPLRFFYNDCLVVFYGISTLVGYLKLDHVEILKTFGLDVARGRMNGAPYETRTLSWKFASLACKPLHHPKHLL